MLRYANHPNYNKEMKYRERLFMNMWAYPYNDKRPIISEVNDLLFNDIPIQETCGIVQEINILIISKNLDFNWQKNE